MRCGIGKARGLAVRLRTQERTPTDKRLLHAPVAALSFPRCAISRAWLRPRSTEKLLLGPSTPDFPPLLRPSIASGPEPPKTRAARQEVSSVAGPAELRAGRRHGLELDRTEPARQMHGIMATSRTAAIGMLASGTSAPRSTARPSLKENNRTPFQRQRALHAAANPIWPEDEPENSG
jgi:hypothetical protein